MKGTPRIVITGFMGAGKTTVARELSRVLACDAVDLDEFITAREGRTPQRLIDEEGEAAFREVETLALGDVLASTRARVVALGGGAWTLERNRRLVAGHGCLTVWLDAPFDLCWHRVIGDKDEERPFARDLASARELYDARHQAYGLAALRVRVTSERSAAELAAEVAREARGIQFRKTGELRAGDL
ncbi:MAG: shikimate kinase [Acidobacteria bacterium]|nr:shikimate kinase [Acidobacteriota bacterium]